jgi:hypothetical protein
MHGSGHVADVIRHLAYLDTSILSSSYDLNAPITSNTPPSNTIKNGATTAQASLGSPGEACRLSWQSHYLSIAVPILENRIYKIMDWSIKDSLTLSVRPITLPTASSTTFTSTSFSTLPRECDNFTRITRVTTSERLWTFYDDIEMFMTIHNGATLPSHVPTYLPFRNGGSVPRLECVIPAHECSKQWALFSEFLRTTTPDLKDWNRPYQYYKSKMDKPSMSTQFVLKNDDWKGSETFEAEWGEISLAGGLMTGSRLLDEILHILHRNGVGLKNFFGGCPQAQKVAANNCQVGLETKFPYQFSDLSDEEAAKHIIKYYGCSLQVGHVRVIHFRNTFPKRKRDICANDGWGEPYEQPLPTGGEPNMTATTTAITFPAHYDYGKSCKAQSSLYSWLNLAI